jgi:aspartate aminotransferase
VVAGFAALGQAVARAALDHVACCSREEVPVTGSPGFSASMRGQTAQASPIRRLSPHADAAKARGVSVLHLNIGQPDIATPRAVIDAYRGFNDKVLAYGPSEGTASYRSALADYYNSLGAATGGRPITAGDVIVTTGGSEALLFAIAATCDPGDEVLVAEPYYPNYKGFSHMLAVGVRPLTTRADDGFALTAEMVRAAIGPRTKLLIVSTPGNPTGAVIPADELRKIGEVCREAGVFFASDEVYRDFVYDGEARTAPSLLAQPGLEMNALMIDSVSKRYSACGARVGCVVTRNPHVHAAMLKFAQTRLSPPVVDQYAAQAALSTPEDELRGAIAEYKRRRDALVAGLSAIPGVSARTPAGAFYLIVQLPVDDAEAFCVFLLREFSLDGETVMLAPADGFYASVGLGRNEVRAAYVLEVPKLERAVAIVREALAAYTARAH